MGVIQQFVNGEITREEADAELKKHGDLLVYEMLTNGFSVRGYADPEDWKNVVMSTGT